MLIIASTSGIHGYEYDDGDDDDFCFIVDCLELGSILSRHCLYCTHSILTSILFNCDCLELVSP